MITVNIKQEVAELEASGVRYETQVTTIDSPTRHKHIYIPALSKHYVKDAEHNWFLAPCTICN